MHFFPTMSARMQFLIGNDFANSTNGSQRSLDTLNINFAAEVRITVPLVVATLTKDLLIV